MDMKKENFKFCRAVTRETFIDTKGITIAASSGEEGISAAEKICQTLKSVNIPAGILKDPEHEILTRSDKPLIVIGNLSDSKCVTYLYYKFLCLTDKYYPGPDGYCIRTILNPFGTGYNIIHIGYSDEKGLNNALNIFISKVMSLTKNSLLPFFSDANATNLMSTSDFIEEICALDVTEDKSVIHSIHASKWWYMGYIAYMNGDMKQLAKYFTGWRKLLEAAAEKPNIGNNFHLYSLTHVAIWRLLEHSGLIPDDLRAEIEQCIFNWAESSEGSKYHHDLRGILPSHNHSMFCAIALIFAADFFKAHYNLKEAYEWRRIGKSVFSSFDNGGWKPVCDDSSYAPNVTLPLAFMYSIYEDDHVFLNQSGRIVSNWIKTILGQDSMLPSYGDGGFGSFPVCILMILSHYFNDGELKSILEKINYTERFSPSIFMYSRAFDSGVKSVEACSAPLISVVPMDRYIYDIWEKDKSAAAAMTPVAPAGPYEQCFDKLSIRTGLDRKDEFLLIDGLGNNGLHAYSDAMGILDYTSKGIVWLVEEMCYQSEPEKCQIVTIARNGYASQIPGYALLEECSEKDGHIYLRMRLKNYSGTDWVREIYFLKKVGLVCNDTVIANEDGNYIICNHFRTPGKVRPEKDYAISDRINHDGERYQMRLKTTATSDFEQSYDERYETQIVKRLVDLADIRSDTSRNNIKKDIPLALKQWDERYHDDNLLITTITSRTAVSMKMGDSATLTTVVNITKPDAQNLDIAYSWDKLEVRSAEAVSTLTTEHLFGNIMKKSRSMKMRDLFMKETADLDSDILIFKPIGRDSFVCALKDNSLVLVKDSECIWKRDFENEIYSVEYTSYNGGMILAGWGDNVLTALDMKSDTIWENRVKAKKTEFPGWEMLTPRIVCIKYGFTDNLHFVAAGCGDNFIRLFDMTGTMLQECYDYATVPDIIELFDVDGDGKPELMGAGKTASNRGAFYIHDINGRALNPIIVGPWLCIFRSHIIRETDGRLCIACGMNYGANFRRLSVEKGKYNEEFSKCIGGTVSAIHMDDDTGNFYVGSSKGAILSFDKNGNDLWYSDAQSPVQDIIPYANSIIAISNNGEIRQVSTEGKIERLSTFSQSVNSCIDGDGNVFISSGHKLFKLI